MEFEKWPKTRRFEKALCVFSEKIDGTKGQIAINEDGEMFVGSRTRWVTPEEDNYGFARWARENEEELVAFLGVGRHYGEWWGQGIQRSYGMDKKVFSLFDTRKFGFLQDVPLGYFPCDVVPFIIRSLDFDKTEVTEYFMKESLAAKRYEVSFDNPEGYMYYSTENAYKNPINK